MDVSTCIKQALLYVLLKWSGFRDKVWPPTGRIPAPGAHLRFMLLLLYRNNVLGQLEFLSHYFYSYGLFKYGDKIYILNTKYVQTVVLNLDKGAENYLSNSPLNNSFLGSSNRNPEVRRTIAALFKKSSMESRVTSMFKCIDKMVDTSLTHTKLNVNDVMLKLALDVVGRVLLGVDLHALDDKQTDILTCMTTILHRTYALGEISPKSDLFIETTRRFDELSLGILEEAVQAAGSETSDSLPHVLRSYCSLEEANANLKLFLMAGSETLAASIPVLVHLLARHPDLQLELQNEADKYMNVLREKPECVPPLLEGFLREGLRLYPTAPYISRHTHSDMQLGDVTIPPNPTNAPRELQVGVQTAAADSWGGVGNMMASCDNFVLVFAETDLRIFIWGIHRSPHLWNASCELVPSRFVKDGKCTRTKPSVYLPFGAGSRICVGQHMAMLEMRLIVTSLLYHFTVYPVPETPELGFCVDWEHAVVHPDQDIIVGLKPRN